ncbi:DNA-directed RNA polymerase [Enhydrobacter aerosaccus]|uniref:DNA-directed RNA polymerase n=1 Tax=Enhydrobacter aerosaccus TaxID=225324 RepID=A0A1T4RN57_9HYPH|nr:DNA-directed RNA polymerase [Enhydrobacter aerosaccus]SKA17445.1 DNA-directed RNA polymerase [Enhydrobacter aerosaccus]
MGNMWEEQRRIEEEATLEGVRRAARAMEKAQAKSREATTQAGSAMVRRIVVPMEALLAADLEKRSAGKATKGGSLLKPLRGIDTRLLCVTATRAALSRMSQPTKLTALCRRIGEALEDEYVWARWERLNKGQARAVRKRVEQSPSAHQRRAALRGFARNWEKRALTDAWTTYRLCGVGLRFIDYLVQLDVFELTKVPSGRKGKSKPAHAVQLTPQAAEWIKEMSDFLSVNRPLNWPLVIPPVPWTTPSGGGFHFREGIDHPLVPRPLKPLPLIRRSSAEQRARLLKADLTVVYAGLNAAQATAWRINPKVHSVMLRMMEDGRGGPGLTALDPMVLPGRLPDEEAADPEKLRAHKTQIRKIKRANAAMVSKRFAQARTLTAARKFVTYPAIYFAYQVDFRGRVYACSDDLSPQGNDLQRGLLEFAQGDPLDADGLRWLLVHAANCYGVDKVSFADREQWARDHLDMIYAVADNPLECTEWHNADEKARWQFLAACFALADYRDNPTSPCRVPVMLDGSCSGIQHYSALMRDEKTGAAVNLVPGDHPRDLYGNVAEEAMRLLAESRAEFSQEWLAWGIDRKIVKRSVMVLPYGGTFLSNLEYLRDSVRKRCDREGRPPWLTDENEQDAYVALAKTVWEAMHTTIKGPIEGMKWVRSVVRAWAAQRPHVKLRWTSPCGFPVETEYAERVPCAQGVGEIKGQPINLGLVTFSKVQDWSRAETAAAPNFVHSLDASHLLFSLKRAREEGITQLAAVHDAFGTTPTKTGQFARILREEFAKLYLWNPFECLVTACREVGVDCPDYPAGGSLKLEDIAKSEYLFS